MPDSEDDWSDDSNNRVKVRKKHVVQVKEDDDWDDDDDDDVRPLRRTKVIDEKHDGLWSDDDDISSPKKRNSDNSAFERMSIAARNSHTMQTTGLSELISLLAQTGVDGPTDIHRVGRIGREKIGTGAQFDVYRDIEGSVKKGNVYKVVKMGLITSNTSNALLNEDEQRQLETIRLEILALSHPPIRDHRNMVRLLGWGYDYPSPDPIFKLPVLIMEEAKASLPSFLENDSPLWDVKYHLCLDVFEATATLHRWNIVHGDMKPDNVLVFPQDDPKYPVIAKVSDFGLCISMEDKANLSYESFRGTAAWNPPEVQENLNYKFSYPFEPSLLFKCDVFSAGLLSVAIMTSNGKPPIVVTKGNPKDFPGLALNVLSKDKSIPSDLLSRFGDMLRTQLDMNPVTRKDVSSDLLMIDGSEVYAKWLSHRLNFENNHVQHQSGFKTMSVNRGIRYWARLNETAVRLLSEEIEKARTVDGDYNVPAETLFGITLALTVTRSSPDYIDKVLDFTAYAALKGHVPAQAVCERLYHAHGRKLPERVDSQTRLKWLVNGAATGSFVALRALTHEHVEEYKIARNIFRFRGGYNVETFSGKEAHSHVTLSSEKVIQMIGSLTVDTFSVDLAGNTLLHDAATKGDLEGVELLLKEFHATTNPMNDNSETSLLRACKAGHADVVRRLLEYGAEASKASEFEGLTPLHFLFNFDDEDMPDLAKRLIQGGAKIEAMVHYPKDNTFASLAFHFPFQWPLGSPLHWAVAARSKVAIDVLCELGADVNARDTADKNGQTAFAMAVIQADVEIMNHLLKKGADVTSLDGAGRTSFHLLSKDNSDWNRGIPLWKGYERWVYLGNKEECQSAVNAARDIFISHGLDINAGAARGRRPIDFATEVHDCNTIRSLLEAGAQFRPVESWQQSPASEWARKIAHRVMPFPDLSNATFRLILTDSPAIDDIVCTVIEQRDNSTEQTIAYLDIILKEDIVKVDINAAHPQTFWPPIQEAAQSRGGAMSRVSLLLRYGADSSVISKYNETLLLLLCKNGTVTDLECFDFYTKYVKVLPETHRRAYVNRVCERPFGTNEGTTALFYAAGDGKISMVKALLDAGAEVNVITVREKYTALDAALDSGESHRRSAIVNAYALFLPPTVRAEIMKYGTPTERPEDSAADLNTIDRYRYKAYPEIIQLLRLHKAKRAVKMGKKGRPIFTPQEWDPEQLKVYGIAKSYDPGMWKCLYE